jgi:prophage regulatory protein
MDEKIDRLPEVIRICGLKRSTIYRLVKLRRFPSPIKVSDRLVGWAHSDIVGWIEKKRRESAGSQTIGARRAVNISSRMGTAAECSSLPIPVREDLP